MAMRRRKIRPSRRKPRPDRAPPLLLTLHKKVERIIQCKRHDGKNGRAPDCPPLPRLQACPAQDGAPGIPVTNRPSSDRSPPKAPRSPSPVPNSLFTAKPAGGLAKNHAQRRRSPPDAIVPRACCFRDAPELHEKARGADHSDPLRALIQLSPSDCLMKGCDYFAAFQASICFCTSATMVSTPLAFSLSTNSSTSSLTSS